MTDGSHGVRRYYHAVSASGPESLDSLSIASSLMQRWSRGNNNGHIKDKPLAFRAKVADIVKLLYEAAVAARKKADGLRLEQIRMVAFPGPAYPGELWSSKQRFALGWWDGADFAGMFG